QGPGPFTVFAPTNAAFSKLPAGTVDSLLKPQMKEKLTAVLTYHVVPGRLSAKDLWEASNKGGGKAKFKTVEGEELTVEFKGQAAHNPERKGNPLPSHDQDCVPFEGLHPRDRGGVEAGLGVLGWGGGAHLPPASASIGSSPPRPTRRASPAGLTGVCGP